MCRRPRAGGSGRGEAGAGARPDARPSPAHRPHTLELAGDPREPAADVAQTAAPTSRRSRARSPARTLAGSGGPAPPARPGVRRGGPRRSSPRGAPASTGATVGAQQRESRGDGEPEHVLPGLGVERMPVSATLVAASGRVSGPSSSARAIVRSALSCVGAAMPSCCSRLLDQRSICGSNSGSIQPASSVAISVDRHAHQPGAHQRTLLGPGAIDVRGGQGPAPGTKAESRRGWVLGLDARRQPRDFGGIANRPRTVQELRRGPQAGQPIRVDRPRSRSRHGAATAPSSGAPAARGGRRPGRSASARWRRLRP